MPPTSSDDGTPPAPASPPPDFIDAFVEWSDGLLSPAIYRKWAAIWAIGSATGRKVWTTLIEGMPLYPNLFLFLVGPPATGKTVAIVPATETLRRSDTVKLAPNDVTKQGLLDNLAKAPQAVTFEGPPPVIVEYHYLAVAVRELTNFMSQYDRDLAGILTDIFDNPPVNHEFKRSGAGAIIINPSMSLMAGTATKNLGATIGKDLWGQGFMSRVIMIYSDETPNVTYFGDDVDESDEDDEHALDTFSGPSINTQRAQFSPELVMQLARIGQLKGRVRWTNEARDAYNAWKESGFAPAPKHPKLAEYNGRRNINLAKLATISALSRTSLRVNSKDFHRALDWLLEAERGMPEIFKEMAVHSDGEVARELHMECFALLSKNPKGWIPYSVMASILMNKVATRDIKRIIENAEEAGMFDRKAGTSGVNAEYRPRADGQLKDLPE